MEGSEVVRRQAEWERQIETLDQKEMELHQTQLRLIREQTATFISDLGVLRQEVSDLLGRQDAVTADIQEIRQVVGGTKFVDSRRSGRGSLSGFIADEAAARDRQYTTLMASRIPAFQQADRNSSCIQERLDFLEKSMGDSADRHDRVLEAHNAHKSTMEDRLAFLEKTVGDSMDKHVAALEDARKRLDHLSNAHNEHRCQLAPQLQKHASLEERMDYFEKLVGDSADKHAQALKDAHSKLDQLHARTAVVEKHGETISALHGHMQKHASTSERLEFLEQAVGDSADKHAKALEELESLRIAHGRHVDANGRYAREVESLKSNLGHHASLEERMRYVEKTLGDSADKHAEDIAAAHARVDKVHGMLSELSKAHSGLEKDHKAKCAFHASVTERLAFLEQSFGDSADKHGKEIEALRAAHFRHEQSFSGHQRDLQSIKTIAEKHATVGERLDYVERLIGDSADKHAAAIEAAQAQLEHVHGRLVQCEKHGTAIGELRKVHSALASEKASLDAHHATLQERVDYIENMLGSSADRHMAEIEALKANHAKHNKMLQDVKALHTHHAALPERMSYLEKMLGDSADKHAEELAAAHKKLDQVHSRLMSCEAGSVTLGDLKKAHSNLANEKKALESHHATLKERVDFLESTIGESADKHDKASAKVDQLHNRLCGVEKYGASITDLQKNHAQLLNNTAHHASLQERMDYIEKTIGDSADRHAKALAALKAAHDKHEVTASKHAKDLQDIKSAHAHHATIEERLNYLERVLGDSADRHAEELAQAHSKLEQMHGRLSICEKNGTSLQHSHNNLANDAKEKNDHHASMADRLDYIEQAFGDSADKHSKELEALKASHAKHTREMQDMKANHAEHAAVPERISYLEKLIGDSADKHAEELRAAHAKLDQMHSRISTCEGHGQLLGDLRKANAELANSKNALHQHHATLQERVDYLETSLGDSADKHAKALEALRAAHSKFEKEARANHGQMNDLLAREADARNEHHASLQERMKYLEGVIGDNADKHARELAAHKAAHSKLVAETKEKNVQHATLEERLSYLETSLGDSADRHNAELVAAHAKFDKLHGRFEDERAATERAHGSLRDMLDKERGARDQHHASVRERVDYLEQVIGDNADKHAKELESAKAAHAKLAGESKARDAKHLSLEERIDVIEKAVNETKGRQSEDFKATQSKVEQLSSRISAVREAWNQPGR